VNSKDGERIDCELKREAPRDLYQIPRFKIVLDEIPVNSVSYQDCMEDVLKPEEYNSEFIPQSVPFVPLEVHINL